jgi:hypothetical protein
VRTEAAVAERVEGGEAGLAEVDWGEDKAEEGGEAGLAKVNCANQRREMGEKEV